jgi:O-antigen/teichoic acid export membrane protein
LSRSLSHQVGILTLGRLVSYAVMFIVPLVNVRTLSKEEYGYYRQFWLLFETLTPILILGFPRSLLYYLPRVESRDERSAYLTQTTLFLVSGSVLAMGIYAVLATTLGEGLGAAARAFYWRLSFFTLFMVVSDYMEVVFVSQGQPVAQSIYHASVWGMQAVVVIVASYVWGDVSTIIWALAFFAMARFLFAIVYSHAHYGYSLRSITWSSIREQASFAVPVGLTGIAVTLVAQTDKFVVSRYLGREALAVYSVGAFQLPLVNVLQTSVGNVTFPLLAQYHKAGRYDAMAELSRRTLLKTSVLFFPVFVFMEMTARPFITILFTKEYAAAVPVFMVYMVLFLRTSFETGAIVQAFNRTPFLLKIFLIGFVINVPLGIGMLFWIGPIGVATATLLTMTAISAASLWYSAKLVGAPITALFPVGELAKRFLAAVAPGAAMWPLYQKHPVTNIVEMGVAGVLYFGMYAALCAWTKLVKLDDLKSLFGKGPTGPSANVIESV